MLDSFVLHYLYSDALHGSVVGPATYWYPCLVRIVLVSSTGVQAGVASSGCDRVGEVAPGRSDRCPWKWPVDDIGLPIFLLLDLVRADITDHSWDAAPFLRDGRSCGRGCLNQLRMWSMRGQLSPQTKTIVKVGMRH